MYFPRLSWLIIISLLLSASIQATEILDLSKQRPLPGKITETSGLAIAGGNIWTINDSGDDPWLYRIDHSGSVTAKVKLKNGNNQDWESLAQDDNYLYIGDIGNNKNKRDRLTIYRVAWSELTPDAEKSKWRVNADKISYSYSQRSGKEPRKAHNFDAEGLTIFDNELWLFSKNRADHKTQLYRIPNQPGHYEIEPSATYDVEMLVTAADIDPATNQLLLLGYNKATGNVLWQAPVSAEGVEWTQAKRYSITPQDQWEAVVWDREQPGQLLFSHEQKKTSSAGLAVLAELPKE